MEEKTLPNNLPVEYVAEYLQICKSTVYEMVRQKQIPSFKIGQRIIIPREQFFEWVREQAKTSQ